MEMGEPSRSAHTPCQSEGDKGAYARGERAVASVWKRSFATPGTGSGAEPGVRHSLHRGGRGICIVGSSNLASYPGPGYEARSKYTSPVDRGVSTTAREKNMFDTALQRLKNLPPSAALCQLVQAKS